MALKAGTLVFPIALQQLIEIPGALDQLFFVERGQQKLENMGKGRAIEKLSGGLSHWHRTPVILFDHILNAIMVRRVGL